MFEETVSFEDDIIDRLDLQNSVKELDPEIQQILYDKYGAQLENMPGIGFMGDRMFAKRIFQRMKQKRCTVFEQKLLLMRYGILTGTPMTLQEVADKMGMSRDRVRMIEDRVLRTPCCLRRSRKLKDYLD